jgi:hypothetical protein
MQRLCRIRLGIPAASYRSSDSGYEKSNLSTSDSFCVQPKARSRYQSMVQILVLWLALIYWKGESHLSDQDRTPNQNREMSVLKNTFSLSIKLTWAGFVQQCLRLY